MSDDVYKARIAELETYINKLQKVRRKQHRDYKALHTEHETVLKERDEWKTKYEAAPNEMAEELDRLKGEIRTRDHKSKFVEVAGNLKVRKEALDDLWNLSGYKAETDTVDEKAIEAAIQSAVEKRPYLLVQEESPREAPQPLQPGPNYGRGAPVQSPPQPNEALMRDPGWALANLGKSV